MTRLSETVLKGAAELAIREVLALPAKASNTSSSKVTTEGWNR